jgi:hypothetical protein
VVERINHQGAHSKDGARTNGAESYFSRLRRAERGQYHHTSGEYFGAYARETAWREDRYPPPSERDAARPRGRRGARPSRVAHVEGLLAMRGAGLGWSLNRELR